MNTHRATIRRWSMVGGACAVAVLVAACTATSSPPASAPSPTAGVTAAVPQEVTVDNQWVRATKGIPDPSMTTVFGEFTNHTDKDLTIVSAVNNLTGRTELHQMTMNGDAMVMGPAVGGIALPANKTTSLDPAGLHIMIMDLKATIQPGDDVTVTATLNDGSKITFDALGKEYAGGNESYPGATTSPTAGMTGMAGMGPTTNTPSSSNG